jgi:hypothetical protein
VTVGRKKEGREPHQHCQHQRQLIVYFVQQPLPLSITNAPALHNKKEKKREKERGTGKRQTQDKEGGRKERVGNLLKRTKNRDQKEKN